jgi:hypothetical protein
MEEAPLPFANGKYDRLGVHIFYLSRLSLTAWVPSYDLNDSATQSARIFWYMHRRITVL